MSPERLESKVDELRNKNKALLAERRDLRKREKELRESRGLWKQKYMEQKQECSRLSSLLGNHGATPLAGVKIARHKYPESLVRLCVSLYAIGGCSSRGVLRVMFILRAELGLGCGSPCKGSILNWARKAGYHAHAAAPAPGYKGGYGLIVDECMVIGQERLLMVLAVGARKSTRAPLRRCDVTVACLKVKPSWKGDSIGEELLKVAEKMGGPPSYVVCDGASNLGNGIAKAGMARICDAGHELARITERVYAGDARYLGFTKAVSQCRFKKVMTPLAYLLPPAQRTQARFMNLYPVVSWAANILSLLSGDPGRFSGEEAEMLAGFTGHGDIIAELAGICACSGELLDILKRDGLSVVSVGRCLETCSAFGHKNRGAAAKWADGVAGYLAGELEKLPWRLEEGRQEDAWHASSDVIESLFGHLKERKADNPLYGVTAGVLLLPLLTRADPDEKMLDIDFKAALEGVLLSDIELWSKEHLIENQSVKRRIKLQKMNEEKI